MQPTTHDPVHGVGYAFTPDGENLIVDSWFEAGARFPEHFHPVQEEHWSVVEGRAKIQNGQFDGVVVPEDGAQIVSPGPGTRSRRSASPLDCARSCSPRWDCRSSSKTARPRPARVCS